MEENNNKIKATKDKRSLPGLISHFLWSLTKYSFIFLILMMMGVYFLIQLPSFQNYAATKATEFLSRELKSEVTVGRIRINFFQKVLLEDFVVKDRQQDTLLNIGELKAELKGGFLGLLDGKINITSAFIRNLDAHLVENCPKYDNNYQFLLNYLENGHPDSLFSRPTGKQNKISLNLNNVELQDVSFNYLSKSKGKIVIASLDRLTADFNEFNLDSNLILVNRLKIDAPVYKIENIEPIPCKEVRYLNPYASLEAELKKRRKPKPNLHIEAQDISIEEGIFSYHNFRHPPIRANAGKVLDFQNIDLSDVNVGLETFIFEGNSITAALTQLAVKTGTPFNINEFSADRISYSPTKIGVENFDLKTDYSHLQDTLSLHYKSMEDFQDFVNKVRMAGRFKNSEISVKDIMVFDPKLETVDFLRHNKDKEIGLDGSFAGTVNNLKGNNLKLEVGKYASLDGNFSLHDITNIQQATLNLNLNTLKTNADGLTAIIPGFKAPEALKKLGTINYSGKLDGYILDFVTYGKVKTAQGDANVDIHLDIRDGAENAKYSGIIGLSQFNLGNLTGNQDLGKVTGTFTIKDGQSFSLESISTELSTEVQSFTYKGYDYKNFKIDGKLLKNTFDGKLVISDPNANLKFDGAIDFSKDRKVLNFNSEIYNLDLSKLNLANLSWKIKGTINSNLTLSDLSDMEGSFIAQNLDIKDTSGHHLELDYLNFNAIKSGNGLKEYTLTSNMVDLDLIGKFEIEQIGQALIKVFHYNHTALANQLGIQSRVQNIYNNDFNFNLNVKDSKELLNLLGTSLQPVQGSRISGYFSNIDSTKYRININGNIPVLRSDNFNFNYLFFEGIGNQESSEYFIFANSGNILDRSLSQMDLSATLNGDSVRFNIKTPQIQKIAENLSIAGIYTVENGYNILKFNQSKFDFFDDGWTVNKDNLVKFGKNELYLKNLTATNGRQEVIFNSYGKQGLEVNVKNFNAAVLDSLLANADLKIIGTGDINLRMDSVFTQQNILLTSHFDSVNVNGIALGKLNLEANAQSLKSKVGFDLSMGELNKELHVTGLYTLPQYEAFDYPPNYIDLLISSESYPLVIADIFLGEMIKDTRGTFTTNFRIKGKTNQLDLNGTALVQNMGTTIRYLGTRYYVPKHTVRINNNMIDLDGLTLLDERGNIASVSGGIKHNRFKNLNADIEINSDNFLMLKTTEKDNPNYYGTASGRFTGKFKGPFDQLNIEIEATTGNGTDLFLPIGTSKEVDALSFIEFKNRFKEDVEKEINKVVTSKGLAFKMNAEVNEKATLNLIIDKQTGDIIKSKGNGILEIAIPRNGNLSMYGGYEVAGGEYRINLIPLYNLSIFGAKFLIKKGGTLIWNGDPINAQVNIDADFKGVNTSPYNFISEYIPEGDTKLQSEANRPTPVDLTLNLRGDLLKPEITFKIDFPQLSPDLRTYVDSKLRSLEQDPNELYKQAASLVSFGSFIPKDNFNLSAVTATAYNTLSDLISSQLTQILSPMLTAAVADGKILTGVDLNLNYNFYSANTSQGTNIQNRIGSELLIGPSLKFFDGRLIVNTGVKSGEQGKNQNYVAGDVDLQYYLTTDRKYVLRLYQNNDAVLEGRRIKSGVGISFQKSMDSIAELFRREQKKKHTKTRD